MRWQEIAKFGGIGEKRQGLFPFQKINEFNFLCNYYQFRAPEQVLYQVCPLLDSSESDRRVAKFPYDESFTYMHVGDPTTASRSYVSRL